MPVGLVNCCCGDGDPDFCGFRQGFGIAFFSGTAPNGYWLWGHFTDAAASDWPSPFSLVADYRVNERFLKVVERQEGNLIIYVDGVPTYDSTGYYQYTVWTDHATNLEWKYEWEWDLAGDGSGSRTRVLGSDGNWTESGDALPTFDFCADDYTDLTTVSSRTRDVTGTDNTYEVTGIFDTVGVSYTKHIAFRDAWNIEDVVALAESLVNLLNLPSLDYVYDIDNGGTIEHRKMNWGETLIGTYEVVPGDVRRYPAVPFIHTSYTYPDPSPGAPSAGSFPYTIGSGRWGWAGQCMIKQRIGTKTCFINREWDVAQPNTLTPPSDNGVDDAPSGNEDCGSMPERELYLAGPGIFVFGDYHLIRICEPPETNCCP